ncbi:thiamine biosynthesis protein ThiC [Campylobacter lari]|nr:thiamine biosynthesis protein ThiC [Campylobacter lari]VEJ07072.1 thiamine biosynthesis protein ThiC [Campylobacter lari]
MVADIYIRYEHINLVIGGVVVAAAGVDKLYYVITAEYLRLLNLEDIRDGIVVTKW